MGPFLAFGCVLDSQARLRVALTTLLRKRDATLRAWLQTIETLLRAGPGAPGAAAGVNLTELSDTVRSLEVETETQVVAADEAARTAGLEVGPDGVTMGGASPAGFLLQSPGAGAAAVRQSSVVAMAASKLRRALHKGTDEHSSASPAASGLDGPSGASSGAGGSASAAPLSARGGGGSALRAVRAGDSSDEETDALRAQMKSRAMEVTALRNTVAELQAELEATRAHARDAEAAAARAVAAASGERGSSGDVKTSPEYLELKERGHQLAVQLRIVTESTNELRRVSEASAADLNAKKIELSAAEATIQRQREELEELRRASSHAISSEAEAAAVRLIHEQLRRAEQERDESRAQYRAAAGELARLRTQVEAAHASTSGTTADAVDSAAVERRVADAVSAERKAFEERLARALEAERSAGEKRVADAVAAEAAAAEKRRADALVEERAQSVRRLTEALEAERSAAERRLEEAREAERKARESAGSEAVRAEQEAAARRLADAVEAEKQVWAARVEEARQQERVAADEQLQRMLRAEKEKAARLVQEAVESERVAAATRTGEATRSAADEARAALERSLHQEWDAERAKHTAAVDALNAQLAASSASEERLRTAEATLQRTLEETRASLAAAQKMAEDLRAEVVAKETAVVGARDEAARNLQGSCVRFEWGLPSRIRVPMATEAQTFLCSLPS